MLWNRLLQLLRPRAPAAPDPSPAPFAPPYVEAPLRLDRLDLQAAVIHHLEWCVLFNDHLGQVHPGEPPPVRTLPCANESELGRWLRDAQGRGPGRHPQFAALVQAHRHFHDLAEEVILLATEDRMDLASTLLNTDFERSRMQVVSILRDMQQG